MIANRSLAGLALVTALSPCFASSAQAQSYSRTNNLFDGGRGFYHSFRIPAVVRATGDVLLAFAEGRVGDEDDWGNINLVYKRSNDNGRSWSGLLEIEGVGPGSWTNPTAVYEAPWTGHRNGRVHLFFNWHSSVHTSVATIRPGDRRTYHVSSDDNGLTWAPKRDLTSKLLPPGFAWDAVGPGAGIQKLFAPDAGRLIVPATKRNFYSDDHGATWSYAMMPTSGSANITGESTIAELLDGSLLRNDRATGSYWATAKRRWVSRGHIPSFPTPEPQMNLPDPRSHASLLRYNLTNQGRLIFLNSDDVVTRHRMKVRISYDEGVTWPIDRWLYVGTPPDYHATIGLAAGAGKGGYSAMTKTGDFHVGALVEVNEGIATGGEHYYSLDFHRFDLAWIFNGQPEPACPTLTSALVGAVDNISLDPFVFDGTNLDLVTTVLFDGVPITSQSSTSWTTGWFSRVSESRIEVYPPQGLAPGPHTVAVATAECVSPPQTVTLKFTLSVVLLGPLAPSGSFELIGSRGTGSTRSMALLAVSTSSQPTIVPGVVSFGIGALGRSLGFVGGAVLSDPTTGAFRWRLPAITGFPPMYFQTAVVDLLASQPLPAPTSSVIVVRP